MNVTNVMESWKELPNFILLGTTFTYHIFFVKKWLHYLTKICFLTFISQLLFHFFDSILSSLYGIVFEKMFNTYWYMGCYLFYLFFFSLDLLILEDKKHEKTRIVCFLIFICLCITCMNLFLTKSRVGEVPSLTSTKYHFGKFLISRKSVTFYVSDKMIV